MAKLTYRNGDGTQIASYVFEYDSLGRLIRSVEYGANNTITQRTEHLYDEYSRLSSQSWVIQGESFSESYTYNDPVEDNPEAPQDGSLKQMTTASGATIDYTYDALKRLSGTTVKNSSGATIFTHAYAYKNLATSNGITQTTTQVEYHNVRNASGIVISGAKYAYDDVGNIVGIYEREPVGSNTSRRLLVAYSYDVQNQLVSETYYTYSGTSAIPSDTTTYSYTYDTAGNIQTESKDGVVTKTYTYGNSAWNDLLTEFDGDPIVYEGQSYNYSTNSVTGIPTSGNPIQYHNGNRSYYMQWEQGRQLSYMAFEDEYNQYQAAFDYDLDGIRTAKYVDNVTHKYITQNGKVVRETIGTGTTAKVLDFIYDESGKPFALKYTNGTEETKTYYYVLNLQGDVVQLVEHTKTLSLYRLNTVATYTYNAWGEIVSATGEMANVNPLRYRGYYYDAETGFYYLQSRYYDPVMHRFINADSYQSTGQGFVGTNMFAYCLNNPVNIEDPFGELPDRSQFGNEMIEESAYGKYLYVFFPSPSFFSHDDTTEIVDNQNAAGIKNIPFGLSTTDHGGCGAIAIHNVVISMGGSSSLRDTNRYIALTGNQVAFGFLGMTPIQVVKVLVNKGYSVYTTPDPDEIRSLSTYADGCILWYAFERTSFPYVGAHFTMYERVSGGYLFHNVGVGGTEFSSDPYTFGSRDTRFGTIGIFVFNN